MKLGKSVSFGLAGVALAAALAVPAGAGAASCSGFPDPYSSAVLADHPSAYYRLDEASGPAMCDSSGVGANGTYLTTGLTFGQPGALPITSDHAVGENSTGNGIGTGGPGLTGDHSFTFEGWLRTATKLSAEQLVNMGSSGTGSIAGLGICTAKFETSANCDPSGAVLFDTYASTLSWPTLPAGVNLFDNSFHMLDVAYDATTGKATAYVDGISLGDKTPPTLNLAPSNIRVGYWIDSSFNKPVQGSADEIAVYPTALPAANIKAHFQASRGSFHIEPRETCAGVCHVVLVQVSVDTAGLIVAEQVLPGQERRALLAGAARHKAPKLLKKTSKQLKAGKNTFKIKLSSAGRKKLATSGKLKVKVRFTFTPKGGAPVRVTKTLKLKPGH